MADRNDVYKYNFPSTGKWAKHHILSWNGFLFPVVEKIMGKIRVEETNFYYLKNSEYLYWLNNLLISYNRTNQFILTNFGVSIDDKIRGRQIMNKISYDENKDNSKIKEKIKELEEVKNKKSRVECLKEKINAFIIKNEDSKGVEKLAEKWLETNSKIIYEILSVKVKAKRLSNIKLINSYKDYINNKYLKEINISIKNIQKNIEKIQYDKALSVNGKNIYECHKKNIEKRGKKNTMKKYSSESQIDDLVNQIKRDTTSKFLSQIKRIEFGCSDFYINDKCIYITEDAYLDILGLLCWVPGNLVIGPEGDFRGTPKDPGSEFDEVAYRIAESHNPKFYESFQFYVKKNNGIVSWFSGFKFFENFNVLIKIIENYSFEKYSFGFRHDYSGLAFEKNLKSEEEAKDFTLQVQLETIKALASMPIILPPTTDWEKTWELGVNGNRNKVSTGVMKEVRCKLVPYEVTYKNGKKIDKETKGWNPKWNYTPS